MSQWGPILAATDLSAGARHAAERAARVAGRTEVDLTVLHVLAGSAMHELRQWLGVSAPVAQQLQDEAGQRLDALTRELQAVLPEGRVSGRLTSGTPVAEVLRVADELDAALVVVGARGESFMRRLILGTTTDRVLRRSRRPVLVVRQLPQVDYRRVMVAVDFSAWSSHSLDLARRVAPGARLVLAHVVQVPYEEKLRYAGVDAATLDAYRVRARAAAVQGLHALAESAGLAPSQWEACVVEGDASLRLVEQEQLLDCDLIVLGKQGQSVAEDLLLGSVTAHVLAEGSADVLVTAVQAG